MVYIILEMDKAQSIMEDILQKTTASAPDLLIGAILSDHCTAVSVAKSSGKLGGAEEFTYSSSTDSEGKQIQPFQKTVQLHVLTLVQPLQMLIRQHLTK